MRPAPLMRVSASSTVAMRVNPLCAVDVFAGTAAGAAAATGTVAALANADGVAGERGVDEDAADEDAAGASALAGASLDGMTDALDAVSAIFCICGG